MIKTKFSKNSSAFFIAALMMVVLTALVAVSTYALTDTTRPTILSVSPANNAMEVSADDVVTVQFSEPMDASTINSDTFTLVQRTTPIAGSLSSEYRSTQLEGIVTYNGIIATFTPKQSGYNQLQPSQEYGNVFTVMVTDGAKDLAGNSLSRNYVWSFTTGKYLFNTGITTSQLDQSATPISGFAVVPFVATTPAIASTTVSTFPWALVILGGLLLILLIALIAFAIKPTHSKNLQEAVPAAAHPISHHSSRLSPFGHVHPVNDIEGIGPKHNAELHAIGIMDTKQLWEADAVKVAHGTDASLGSVKSWQNMAELASVKDIGPQYAELLERSGVHSIGQLKKLNPNKLLKLVRDKQNSLKINIQGNTPGYAMVDHWIHQARGHKFSSA